MVPESGSKTKRGFACSACMPVAIQTGSPAVQRPTGGQSFSTPMGFSDAPPIFVDTNLGTHLALPVPPDITAADLKRQLEREHFYCFPSIGEIEAQALMVKRKTHFYHLSDSMPIQKSYQGLAGTWFLHMNASQSVNMPRQEANVPSGSNHSTRQDNYDQREPFKPNSKVSPDLENLTALNNSNWCEQRTRKVMSIQVLKSPKTKDSMPNASNVTDCSKPEQSAGSRDTNMKSQTSKNGRDHSMCNEQLDVLPLPICGKKKRKKRKLWEQGNSTNVGTGYVKDIAEGKHASTQKMHTHELNSGLNPDKAKEIEDNTFTDESRRLDQEDKNMFSEPPPQSRPDGSSSTVRQTSSISLTEQISLTGLISRYFSDNDEVNSCSSLRKHMQNTEKLTPQFHRALKHEKNQQNEITGCANNAAKFSANQKSSKRIALDSDTFCSFNISSERLEDDPVNLSNRRLDENEIVTFASEIQNEIIAGKMMNDSILAVGDECSSFQADQNQSFRNKFVRTKHQVNRKMLCVTPHCSLMNSPSLSFDKHAGASRSKCGRNEIGKRLVQAANSVRFSGKKLPQSMFVSRSGNLSTPESVLPIKKLPFEIDDSDD